MADTTTTAAAVTVADLVIEMLAAENLELSERLAVVEADRDAYRELVGVLLDIVHAWHVEPGRQRDRDRRHRAEMRALVGAALMNEAI